VLPFEGDQYLCLLIQNLMYPKNSHRVDLVKTGKYCELKTLDEVETWKKALLNEALTASLNEFKGK
jgi:hypothetical protein